MSTAPAARPPLKGRLGVLFEEYGRIAVYTYLALSLSAIAGFSIAFASGLSPSSATGFLGVLGAGWLAAKATMPIRILLTLALTPAIGALLRRRHRGERPATVASTADAPPST